MSHRQRYKWPCPQCELVLDMHFAVHHPTPKVYHAEFTIEIPVKDGMEYFSIGVTRNTERAALRRLIEIIETSGWFTIFREKGVRFRVTGPLESVYRGYL